MSIGEKKDKVTKTSFRTKLITDNLVCSKIGDKYLGFRKRFVSCNLRNGSK